MASNILSLKFNIPKNGHIKKKKHLPKHHYLDGIYVSFQGMKKFLYDSCHSFGSSSNSNHLEAPGSSPIFTVPRIFIRDVESFFQHRSWQRHRSTPLKFKSSLENIPSQKLVVFQPLFFRGERRAAKLRGCKLFFLML